jgi:hypothetical protein
MDDKPTILSRKDIDNISKSLYEKSQESLKLCRCCTCERIDVKISFVHGIQCEDCYIKRIPMFGTSPVSDSYFKLE